MQFTIFSDGACSGNKRDNNCPGGYGFIILDPSGTVLKEDHGRRINVTNNIMEIVAVTESLKYLKRELDECYGGSSKHDCLVITDSKYVCENYSDYILEWKKRGWRKSNGTPVINEEYWKEMDRLTPEFKSFRFQWVKGHAKNRFNERADALAHTCIKELNTNHQQKE